MCSLLKNKTPNSWLLHLQMMIPMIFKKPIISWPLFSLSYSSKSLLFLDSSSWSSTVRRKWLTKKPKLSTENRWMKSKSNLLRKTALVVRKLRTQHAHKSLPQVKLNKSKDLLSIKTTMDQRTFKTLMISLRLEPLLNARNVWPEKFGMNTKTKAARKEFHLRCAFSPELRTKTLELVYMLAPTDRKSVV